MWTEHAFVEHIICCCRLIQQIDVASILMFALQGTLIFLCGGDKELYEYASPLLDVMGKAKFFLGEV